MEAQDCYKNLEKSPMFKLSLSSKELFHSNFLEWLSTVEMEQFKKLILQMAGVQCGKERDDWTWDLTWEVKREYNNFDLCIVEGNPKGNVEEEEDLRQERELHLDGGENEHAEDIQGGRILFVLENKVKSIPYEGQLKQYSTEAEEMNGKFYYKEAEKEVDVAEKERDVNKTIMLMEKEDPKVWYMREKGKIKNADKKWFKWNSVKKSWESLKYQEISNKNLVAFSKTNYYSKYEQEKKKNKEIRYVLLSLATDFPNMPKNNLFWNINTSKDPLVQVRWKIVPYRKYVDFVGILFLTTIMMENNYLAHLIIKDYCGFVCNLSCLADNWKKKYQDVGKPFLHFDWGKKENEKYIRKFKEDFITARDHRIHDLYQKLKYSYLCTKLYDKVKEIVGNKIEKENVYPSNQGGLFKKDSSFYGKRYIYVNYTYLHGEPLLEINIHPSFYNNDGYEIYYTIQVQGGVYEHGYQVRKWKNGEPVKVTAAEVWKELIKDNKSLPFAEKWMRLPCSEDINTDWAKSHNDVLEKKILPMRKNPEDDKPKPVEKGNKRVETKNGYNKYDMNDSTYIYQSRRIENHATIGQVIGLMLKDVEKVVKLL